MVVETGTDNDTIKSCGPDENIVLCIHFNREICTATTNNGRHKEKVVAVKISFEDDFNGEAVGSIPLP